MEWTKSFAISAAVSSLASSCVARGASWWRNALHHAAEMQRDVKDRNSEVWRWSRQRRRMWDRYFLLGLKKSMRVEVIRIVFLEGGMYVVSFQKKKKKKANGKENRLVSVLYNSLQFCFTRRAGLLTPIVVILNMTECSNPKNPQKNLCFWVRFRYNSILLFFPFYSLSAVFN